MRTKISSPVREQPTFIEAARKAQIIEAALTTISELGFANASLAQIARRASISKGVIGYYFPTKDALIEAAMEHFYMAGHGSMMAELDKCKTPVEMLSRYIETNLQYIADNRVGTRAVGEVVANFRRPNGELFYKAEDAEPMIQGTEAIFAWGQQAGDFRAFDKRIMAVTLRGAIDNFGSQLATNEDLDVELYARELKELFMHAVRKDG
jgi:AcrR family transcriptional regulator